MTTTNPSSVPLQPSQDDYTQSTKVSVTNVRHYLTCSLSYTSIQASGGVDHELWSDGNPLYIDSAGPYPALNYDNTSLSSLLTSSMGYDDLVPDLAIVSSGRS
jgi:hypothetical protein